MKRITIENKSKSELRDFIRESEELIAQTQRELEWARNAYKKKSDKSSIANGAYYAKEKDGTDALLVQVIDSKADSYCDLAADRYWYSEGRHIEYISRKPKIRTVKNALEMTLNGKKWTLELLVSYDYADLEVSYNSDVTYKNIPILSDYDRKITLIRWRKLFDTYPAFADAINRLIDVTNFYYNTRFDRLTDSDSHIFDFTDKDNFKALVESTGDSAELKTKIRVLYNILLYFNNANDGSWDWALRKQRVDAVVRWINDAITELEAELGKSGENFDL